VARAALRCILSSYAGARPEQLVFEYGALGKPALANVPLQFNLAHAGGMALCAVALQAVGVDVEDMRRPIDDMDDVARRFFAKREWEQFNALPAHERRAAFFRCWTRKEAFIKAIGDGLSYPLNRFAVSFNADQPPALESIDGDANAARAWSLLDIQPATDYAGAVVVHAPACRLTCWSWQMS